MTYLVQKRQWQIMEEILAKSVINKSGFYVELKNMGLFFEDIKSELLSGNS